MVLQIYIYIYVYIYNVYTYRLFVSYLCLCSYLYLKLTDAIGVVEAVCQVEAKQEAASWTTLEDWRYLPSSFQAA